MTSTCGGEKRIVRSQRQVKETKYQKYLVELNKTFSNDSYGLCQVLLLDDKWGCKSNANQHVSNDTKDSGQRTYSHVLA